MKVNLLLKKTRVNILITRHIHVKAIKYSVKLYLKPNLDIAVVMLRLKNAVQCLLDSFYT